MIDKKQLLEQLLQSSQAHKVLEYLQVIQSLLMQYGKKLTFPAFLAGVEKVDSELGALIRMLMRAGLMKSHALAEFIREFQVLLPQEKLSFQLKSNDEDIIAPLTAYLEKKFGDVDLAFEKVPSDNLMVKMKGQGYSFKRSLEKDIDKLLA